VSGTPDHTAGYTRESLQETCPFGLLKLGQAPLCGIIEEQRRRTEMKATAQKISPEDYILSVLSPEDRLDAALKVASEAFKKTRLTMKDVEQSVSSIRRKIYGKKK
jgi:hypothetical protein